MRAPPQCQQRICLVWEHNESQVPRDNIRGARRWTRREWRVWVHKDKMKKHLRQKDLKDGSSSTTLDLSSCDVIVFMAIYVWRETGACDWTKRKEEGLRTTEEKADLVLTLEWVSGERREGKGAPGRLRAVFSVRFVQADRGRRRKLRTPRLYDPCGFCSISRGNRQIPGETEQESKIKLKWVWTKMLMREEWGDPSSSRFPRLRPQNSLTSAGNFYF